VEHPFFLLRLLPPTTPLFLPPPSHRGQPTLASLRPIQPFPEHRAAVYNLPTTQAINHQPRMSPPPPFPSDRPHLAVECILLVSSSFLPPQNVSTTLPPCSPDPPRYTSSSDVAGILQGRHQCRCGRAPSPASPRWATSPSGWATWPSRPSPAVG
jgi:hypothetical protein